MTPARKSAENDTPMTAEPFLPERRTLPAMREAVQHCRGCDLYKNATQAVFGEGPSRAQCVMVGEQPGNDEDLKGHPFVGPAGRVLDRALADAGIDRELVFVTNAVKHFKNEQHGARRLHRTPDAAELRACRPWLEQEIAVTKPKVLVCLGANAARSVVGKKVTLKELRGRFFETDLSAKTLVTMHPSAILRSPDEESRHQKYDDLVADLKIVAREL